MAFLIEGEKIGNDDALIKNTFFQIQRDKCIFYNKLAVKKNNKKTSANDFFQERREENGTVNCVA